MPRRQLLLFLLALLSIVATLAFYNLDLKNAPSICHAKYDERQNDFQKSRENGTNKENILLFIGVVTSTGNKDRRDALRNTWLKDWRNTSMEYNGKPNPIRIAFFVGKDDNLEQQRNVESEASEFGDIVIADFHDTYRNLTLKTFSIVNYAVEHYNFDFMMKVDDDVFLHLTQIIHELEERKRIEPNSVARQLYWGKSFQNFRPIRDPASKWFTSLEDYPDQLGPRWVSGTCYTMSYEIAYHIYVRTRDPGFRHIPIEDVQVGMLVEELCIPPIYDHRFQTVFRCEPDTIAIHRVDAAEQYMFYYHFAETCCLIGHCVQPRLWVFDCLVAFLIILSAVFGRIGYQWRKSRSTSATIITVKDAKS